jgi:hypothetical protein
MAVASTLQPFPHVSVPLPESHAERLTPERLQRENTRHDRILAGLFVLLAFLLASFPVTNADVWMHLKVGQMIVEGEYVFGVDPFSYTTEGIYWSNPGWSADVLIYSIFQVAGGPGLVVFRSLIVVALVLVLLAVRRPRGSLFVSVFLVSLGVIALTPRLFLRPELFSLLFLGVTVHLLWMPTRKTSAGFLHRIASLTPGRGWVWLPFLFLLWANLDQWVLLGLVTVALYWLGETLHELVGAVAFRREALTSVERKRLLWVLIASVVACFINPHHYHVFQIPGELWSPALELVTIYEPQSRVDVSPFDFSRYFVDSRRDQIWFRPRGLSFAEWCYYPFLVLTAVSFLLNRKHWSWSRTLVWLAFFALSVWQARNIPFFAIVAAPLAVLNLHDWLRARFGEMPTVEKRWLALGQVARIVTLFAFVAMLCLLVFVRYHEPGLQRAGREAPLGIVHQRGAPGWSILLDRSLEQSAKQLAEWRREQRLPGQSLALPFSEQPYYAAYFGPENRSFVDPRFKLHEEAMKDYYLVHSNLSKAGEGPAEARDAEWQDIFRRHNISHIVIGAQMEVRRTDPNTKITYAYSLASLLLTDRDRLGRKKWQQLDYSDGRTFVLAWTGSPHWEQLKRLKVDPEREAFRQAKETPPIRGLVDATMPSPVRQWLAGEIRWRPLACDEMLWQIQFAQNEFSRVQREVFEAGLLSAPQFLATSLAGVPVPLLPAVTEQLTGAHALLAVRAGRRAIAENPLHDDSHFYLYRAYTALQQMESYVVATNHPLRELQMVSALRQAALLRNDEPERHIHLARYYFNRDVPELGLLFAQKAIQAIRLTGMRGGLEGADLEDAISRMGEVEFGVRLDRAEQRYRNLRAQYNARAQITRDPIDRAQYALSLRLGDQARQDFEAAVALMRVEGPFTERENNAYRSLLELYLALGFSREARLLYLRPDAAMRLQEVGFHQFGSQIAVTEGNYELALRHSAELDRLYKQASLERALLGLTNQTLGGDNEPAGSALAGMEQLYESITVVKRRADQLCQMGLLALEAGLTADAAEYFRRAGAEVHSDSNFRPLAGRYYFLITGKRLGEDQEP